MSLSFWERSHVIPTQDLIVIGSGITGIQAAIAAKREHPNWKVTVLERGPFPAGASTKNAGFACIGSLSEIAEDISKIGPERTFAVMERRYKGLQILREQLGDEKLDFHACGGTELFRNSDSEIHEASSAVASLTNQAIMDFAGVREAFTPTHHHEDFKGVAHGWFTTLEGQLNPFMMIQSLLLQAKEMGIRIQTGIEVTEIRVGGGKAFLDTQFLGELSSGLVVVATNGFSRKLLPDLHVRPVRNQVLITSEIPDLTWTGTFHYDRGYVYFRNVGKRILLGGFRNLGGKEEETDQFGLTEILQNKLQSFLHEVILPGQEVEITHRWSGILGVGESKEPIIEEVMPGVFVAVRLGGMGVALGSLLGQEVASRLG